MKVGTLFNPVSPGTPNRGLVYATSTKKQIFFVLRKTHKKHLSENGMELHGCMREIHLCVMGTGLRSSLHKAVNNLGPS